MGYLDSTGLARLIDNIRSHTVSLTTLALPLVPSGWLESPLLEGYSRACEVTATGVTSSSLVVVNPTPESMDAYSAAGIACISQTTDSLAFACTSQPSDTIDVIVTVFNGGSTLYGIACDTDNLSVSKSCASAGETITVTNLTNEAQSWTLNGVDQTDISANGTATFTMPSERVVVGESVYTITYSNGVQYGPTSAKAGDTVSVNTGAGYIIKATTESNVVIANGVMSITFTMPAENVIITLVQGSG